MQDRFELSTPRLTLVGADDALLRAELESQEALAVAIDSTVPVGWPPEHHDRGVIEWVLKSLDMLGPDEPWRLFYIVLSNPRACRYVRIQASARCTEMCRGWLHGPRAVPLPRLCERGCDGAYECRLPKRRIRSGCRNFSVIAAVTAGHGEVRHGESWRRQRARYRAIQQASVTPRWFL